MQIEMRDLYRFVSKEEVEAAKLRGHGQYMSILRRFYCNQLTQSGKCPLICEMCIPNIKEAINIEPNGKDGGGIVVWKLRNMVQNMNTQAPVPEVRKDEHGFASGIDVWSSILDELDPIEVDI
jgi:hypothetical protein